MDGPGYASTGTPIMSFPQVDDATRPFKTIQAAIDAVEHHLVTSFNAGNTTVEGIVYAMPGWYGPHPPNSSFGNGERLPIIMRDRVHVRGQGARGSVIRGLSISGTFDPNVPIMLPMLAGVPAPQIAGEVLVDFSRSSKEHLLFPQQGNSIALPWKTLEETMELFDGFTLQGGDVQVLVHRDLGFQAGDPEIRARVTNCLFDMRHNWSLATEPGAILVPGPYFGIQMAKRPSAGGTLQPVIVGYPEQRMVIANNTFIMCELTMDQSSALYMPSRSRDEAVAIIDTTSQTCQQVPIDPDAEYRGLGSPIIANNLFRTHPYGGLANVRPFAMLGIDDRDTLLGTPTSAPMPCNAFAPALVGGPSSPFPFSNGFFRSRQVLSTFVTTGAGIAPNLLTNPLYDCHNPGSVACQIGPTNTCCPSSTPPAPCASAGVPVPIVEIFYGGPPQPTPGLDPGFVGEWLQPGIVTGPRYRDWRILPGSPLIDAGVAPSGSPPSFTNAFGAGINYFEPLCPELQSFQWDHEGFGNPRVSGPTVDIGFDEFQMFIMSGSYANDSNSHNTSGFLNPTPTAGQPTRVMILPLLTGLATSVRINGTNGSVPVPPPNPSAWIQPPRTTIVVSPLLPTGFQTRWISFANNPATGTPTPWDSTGAGVLWTPSVLYTVPWSTSQSFQFATMQVPDSEPSGPPSNPTAYFGTQAVFHHGVLPDDLWSNLQYEYR